jgi:hypothetical protein
MFYGFMGSNVEDFEAQQRYLGSVTMRPTTYFSTIVGLLLPATAFTQMSTGAGTNMVVDAPTTLRVNTGTVWQIPSGANVINDGIILLGPAAELLEAPGAAITGAGKERIELNIATPPSALDAGGLGGILTSPVAPGITTFIRGHVPYTDYSGHTSIARWIQVLPSANAGLNATFSLRYELDELNAVPESAQILHIRAQDDIWWMLPSNVNTTDRTVTTTGLDSLGLFTTFDQDLPNGLANIEVNEAFLVGMSTDGRPWLQVPAEHQVTQLELIDPAGRLIAMTSTRLGPGLHHLPFSVTSGGIHFLRLNSVMTYPLAWP